MKRKTFDWKIPPEIEHRLGDTSYGRQRAIHEADNLLLVLHAPPGPDDMTREERIFLRTPDGAYLCNGKPEGESKLRRLLKDYREKSDELEAAYQKAQSAKQLFAVIESAAPLSHSASNLRDALQSAREQIKGDTLLIAARDEAYQIARNLELLLADARCALEYRMAQHAETQAQKTHELAMAQHKLNVLAAITFPLLIVATLFGMNLPNGCKDASPILFYLVAALGLVIGICVKSWVTGGYRD